MIDFKALVLLPSDSHQPGSVGVLRAELLNQQREPMRVQLLQLVFPCYYQCLNSMQSRRHEEGEVAAVTPCLRLCTLMTSPVKHCDRKHDSLVSLLLRNGFLPVLNNCINFAQGYFSEFEGLPMLRVLQVNDRRLPVVDLWI